ncbi:MAG: right-handed parallel beta-helix repeat-containing protein, partial [Saprospiraceae bacterium]
MKRIIILFLLFLPVFGFSNRITVCLTCPISTIQQAIDTAKEGDEIFIKKGIYKEYDIVIDKSLSIIGENYPIIDGESKGEIITIIANYVSITGIQVQNVGTSYIKDQAGIRVKKSKHFKLQSNRLRNTFFGIYLEHARDGEVINNEVIGEAIAEMSSGNGIHAWYCKNIKIEDNWVTNHRDGIYFEFVDSSYICCNNSKDNLRYGLHFMFSNDDEYTKNTFNDNGAGVAVMFSRRINMFENKFIKNWGASSYGLLLKEIYDAEISNNIFQENTIGIYIEGS